MKYYFFTEVPKILVTSGCGASHLFISSFGTFLLTWIIFLFGKHPLKVPYTPHNNVSRHLRAEGVGQESKILDLGFPWTSRDYCCRKSAQQKK